MRIHHQRLPNIKKDIGHTVETLLNEYISAQPGSLAASHINQKKLSIEKLLIDGIEQFKEECCKGIELMLNELSSIMEKEKQALFAQEYQQFLQQMNTEKQKNNFFKLLDEGKSCREAFLLSDFFMSSLYQAATHFFELKQYKDAISSFASLCWLDKDNYVYPLFLGFSYFQNKKYEEALYAYMAAAPNAPDTTPLLYMAECFLHLGNPDKAKLCAEKGLEEEQLSPTPDRDRIALFEKIAHFEGVLV